MKACVIGIGNVLMSDEGVGVRVAEKLVEVVKSEKLENVEVYDGGNLNFQLLEYMSNSDLAIFVDAIDFDGHAGEVRVFDISDVEGAEFFTIHDLDYTKIIGIAKMCGVDIPEKIFVVGIKPEIVKEGLELSDSVKNSLDEAVNTVLDIIKKFQES